MFVFNFVYSVFLNFLCIVSPSPYTRCVRKVKIHHVLADREIFYAYYGNTAVDLDPLPMNRARLTVVEPALFQWDVFETAAPIQSPAKCEVRSAIRFLNAKRERPAEIHKQIVAVYGNVMNRQNVTNKETSRWEKFRRRWWGARRSRDVVQRAGGRFMTRGYRSWFQDLINVWTVPATVLEKKVMYRQFIQCRFYKLTLWSRNFLLNFSTSCI